jgi:hypothetical protein
MNKSTRITGLKHVPSLQEFMLRREAVGLYIKVCRLTKHMEADSGHDLRRMARQMYDDNKCQKDVDMIKFLIAEGRKQLKVLEGAVLMTK